MEGHRRTMMKVHTFPEEDQGHAARPWRADDGTLTDNAEELLDWLITLNEPDAREVVEAIRLDDAPRAQRHGVGSYVRQYLRGDE